MNDREVEQKLLQAGDEWRREALSLEPPYAGFRRRIGRQRRVSPSGIASSALVAVGAIVVAVVLFERAVAPAPVQPSSVAAASASASPTISSHVASPSATVVASPTVADSPPPTAPTTPITSPAWLPVSATGGITPHWSPDGNYLLLDEQDESSVVLVGLDGQIIGAYDGYVQPTWLSNDEFVAYRESAMPGSPKRLVMADAIIVNAIDVSIRTTTFPCCDPLGNSHGAAATTWSLADEAGVPQPQYSVWLDGLVTDPQPGFPIAWSPDGEKLVIAHPVTPQDITDGWMEVVGWPGLQSIFRGDRTSETGLKTPFDPTGHYVAHAGVVGSGDQTVVSVDVSNLDTGEATQIPTQGNHMSFAWNAEGEVLVSDSAGLTEYTPDGVQVAAMSFSGTIVGSSSDGSTVLLIDDGGALTTYPNGVTFPLPTTPESETTFWLSPTGKGIFIISNGGPWLAQLP